MSQRPEPVLSLKVREPCAMAMAVTFYSLLALLPLIWLWPYLSFDFGKSWIAFRYRVPLERIVFSEEPHDCEYDTAPIGNKHCHYEAKVFTVSAADCPERDGKSCAAVSYLRIED